MCERLQRFPIELIEGGFDLGDAPVEFGDEFLNDIAEVGIFEQELRNERLGFSGSGHQKILVLVGTAFTLAGAMSLPSANRRQR
jgi:hypothetical protein